MTLHVYAAHVQMPTLVLTHALQPMPSLAANRFAIRMDGGAPFEPSSVRFEGDDPIALAILLDTGGDTDRLLAEFGPALVRLRTSALRAQDTLMLYAIDCKTIRYSTSLPSTPAGVEHALHVVLDSTNLHRGSTLPTCGNSLRLWDSMMSMVTALSEQPGRRVLLALTAGRDHGSKTGWNSLRAYAALNSVAIFGITRPEILDDPKLAEVPLWNLCALTGGLLLPGERPKALPERVQSLLDIVRGRYILEFPRFNQIGSGKHVVDVQVVKSPTALVRTTGLSVPILEDSLRNDPNTVPYMEADKPAIGTRRPMAPDPPRF